MRLAVFSTHPIQYQVPIWRELAKRSELECQVIYCCDHGLEEYRDTEFDATFSWDVPLLDGYESTVLRKGSLSTKGILKISRCRQLLEGLNPDCIMIHGYYSPYTRQIRYWAKRLGIKLLVRGEFSDRRPVSFFRKAIGDAYRYWFYRGVDAFCYIGSDAREHLQRFRVPERKLYFSPYAVDTQLFENHKLRCSRSSSRQTLGIPGDALVYLFSGKLIERKQPLLFGRAVSELASDEKVFCIVIGEGPQRAQLQEQLGASLGKRLIWPGFVNQSELAKYYVAADVLVLPSLFDSWGLVVNEAMQFGIPTVVSSMVGCAPDLVQHGKTGFIFEVGNLEQLVSAMRQFLLVPGLSLRMGESAKETVSRYTPYEAAGGILRAALWTTTGT